MPAITSDACICEVNNETRLSPACSIRAMAGAAFELIDLDMRVTPAFSAKDADDDNHIPASVSSSRIRADILPASGGAVCTGSVTGCSILSSTRIDVTYSAPLIEHRTLKGNAAEPPSEY
jgi:hypothetical protein